MPDERLQMDIARLRESYTRGGLLESESAPDPMVQFARWFQDAMNAGLREPNAMCLSTATCDGIPSGRIVLLKSFDASGFVFFTNYESRKGRELEANPRASLTFFWNELERQVRVAGRVERLAAELSEEYFATRPRESQVGAWASAQSREVGSREDLAREFARLQEEYEGREIPKPEHWGGYVVLAEEVEFWQGRVGRMHDRLLYRKSGEDWERVRLAP